MEGNEFDGLKREDVAFYLKNKLHASFAAKKLLTHGEKIRENKDDILFHPKGEFLEWLVYLPFSGQWCTNTTDLNLKVFPISELPNFLKHLGLNDDKYQKALQEIDELDRQATSGKRYGRTGLSNKGR